MVGISNLLLCRFFGILQQNLRYWCDQQLQSIHQRCVLAPGDCLLWTGGTSTANPNKYGRKMVNIPMLGIKRKVMYTHRLVYMCHNYDIGILDKNNPLEVSHLCHNTLCACPYHLVLETHERNAERITCRMMGECTKGHSPECIFSN